MKYLLDVNALIALKHRRSPHHEKCREWAANHGLNVLATCALVELGFLRVSVQAYGVSFRDARKDLAELKSGIEHYIEHCPAPNLPDWAGVSSRTTDAYLMQLAKSAGMQLATCDTSIPGATLIS